MSLKVKDLQKAKKIIAEAERKDDERLAEAVRRWEKYGECDHPRIFLVCPAVCAICGKEFE
jgi:hypothetical protein